MTVAVSDDLWSAIGDPTRRRMLDLLLAGGPRTATTLSDQLPVTRQAVAKHLSVLDRVGLVNVTPVGREKRYEVDEAQLAPLRLSSRRSARHGMRGCSASRRSPKRFSSARSAEPSTSKATPRRPPVVRTNAA